MENGWLSISNSSFCAQSRNFPEWPLGGILRLRFVARRMKGVGCFSVCGMTGGTDFISRGAKEEGTLLLARSRGIGFRAALQSFLPVDHEYP